MVPQVEQNLTAGERFRHQIFTCRLLVPSCPAWQFPAGLGDSRSLIPAEVQKASGEIGDERSRGHGPA